MNFREALLIDSVRYAEIYKVAARLYQPPRLRAQFWETLMRAATPYSY